MDKILPWLHIEKEKGKNMKVLNSPVKRVFLTPWNGFYTERNEVHSIGWR